MHVQERVIVLSLCACVCVCVCFCPSVRPSMRLSTVFLKNRSSSELQTWICYELGCLDSKLRFWSGEASGNERNGPAVKVSVR